MSGINYENCHTHELLFLKHKYILKLPKGDNNTRKQFSNSVIIVSDYTLDDRGSIPGRGKGFFL
jgi:hypothetical protein